MESSRGAYSFDLATHHLAGWQAALCVPLGGGLHQVARNSQTVLPVVLNCGITISSVVIVRGVHESRPSQLSGVERKIEVNMQTRARQ